MPSRSGDALTGGRRNLPVQERSLKKVDSILAVGRAIMADPKRELTVREIEDQVGFSAGTIYRYFESLEAIVDSVLEQHANAAEAEVVNVLEEIRPASLQELIGSIGENFISFYRREPQFTQLRFAGEYSVRYAQIEEESNERLVSLVAQVAIGSGLMPSGQRSRTRLLVHWSAIGSAMRLAFRDDPQGDRVVLAEARAMISHFAEVY